MQQTSLQPKQPTNDHGNFVSIRHVHVVAHHEQTGEWKVEVHWVFSGLKLVDANHGQHANGRGDVSQQVTVSGNLKYVKTNDFNK